MKKTFRKISNQFLNTVQRVGNALPHPATIFALLAVLVAFLNLFMGSASAKWALLAPVFVPMFMRLGFTPEFTQLTYRLGDSATNIITPIMPYFAMMMVFMQRYDPKAKMGTLIAYMLPYSVVFFISWCILLTLWMLLNLPIGINAVIRF